MTDVLDPGPDDDRSVPHDPAGHIEVDPGMEDARRAGAPVSATAFIETEDGQIIAERVTLSGVRRSGDGG